MLLRVAIVLCGLAIASTEPLDAAMKEHQADAKYAAAIQKAQTAYEADVAGARTIHIQNLQQVLQAALLAKDLTEANRIDAELKALQQKNSPTTDNQRDDLDEAPTSTTLPTTQKFTSSKSPLTAFDADAVYKREIRSAKETDDKAIAAARASFISDLRVALDTAFHEKNLVVANRIDAKLSPNTEKGTTQPVMERPAKETLVQLPKGVTRDEVDRVAGQLRLSASLVNTSWQGLYGDPITFLEGGVGESVKRRFDWNAINDSQVIVIWSSKDVDLLTFNLERRSVVKRWVGSSLKNENPKEGKQIK